MQQRVLKNKKNKNNDHQSSSPLMMFGGDRKKTPVASQSNLRAITNRRGERSGAGVVESDQVARGISGQGIIESTTAPFEEEGGDGSLRLDHFRTALVHDPKATCFVINENEENGLAIQSRAAGTSRFALNKNKVENTTVTEALRELLLT